MCTQRSALSRNVGLASSPDQIQVNRASDEAIRSRARAFDDLALSRHSVRTYSGDDVPLSVIEEAVQIAGNSPSSCNRQPWKDRVLNQSDSISEILDLQGGLKGWSIPSKLVAITTDRALYADPSERQVAFVDGGLFAMSLVYALHARGIATCMLNAAHSPRTLGRVRRRLALDHSEALICYVAVGMQAGEPQSPRSLKLPPETILTVLNGRPVS